jgi:adenine-specific DNA-methyltransferase
VESVPAASVLSLEFLVDSEKVDSFQFSVDSGETKNWKLKTKNFPDSSIARSGETLRQAEWRDELLRTGVRAKGGQIMKFSRLEPMGGTRFIQCEGEIIVDSEKVDSFQFSVDSEDETQNLKLKTNNSLKTLVVFGPEHAPLEQRMVENAWQEARLLKPDMLLFCAFQFDEEAAKDIDELTPEITGMQLLKAQMNSDLFTDDLRKKRSSNESFWLIGQPDVKVYSFQFIVYSNQVIGSYDVFKELSGLDSLAKINELSDQDLQLYLILSQGRDVWHYLTDEKGWNIYTGKHSGGTGKAKQKGISSISLNSSGFVGRVRDFYNNLGEFGISHPGELKELAERLRRDKKIIIQLKEIAELVLSKEFLVSSAKTKNSKLTTKNYKLETKNYAQVEVIGFDYYNPKTGNVESGGKKNIAMWMLDTDYDNRSVFPSQVFFPMAGSGDGWDRLAKNLKAEIDEEKIEAFAGTMSLEFEPGDSIAVKIIDDRGIESLRVIKGVK